MMIDSTKLAPLLEELIALTPEHQRIYFYLLTQSPTVYMHSSDPRMIAAHLGIHPRTVRRAIRAIRSTTILGRTINIIDTTKQELQHEYQTFIAETSSQTDPLPYNS